MIYDIKNKKTGEILQCDIRQLQPEDIDLVMNFQQEQYELLEDKEKYVCTDADEFLGTLKDGIMLGAFYKGKLVHFVAAEFPKLQKKNLGRDLGYPEEELEHIAHLECVMTDKVLQGCGITTFTYSIIIEMIKNHKEIKHILCTIHPDNIPSIKAVKRIGFEQQIVKEKYGGHLRAILQLNVNSEE